MKISVNNFVPLLTDGFQVDIIEVRTSKLLSEEEQKR